LADEVFAIPVEPVRQVVRVSDITRVPHAPRPIRGVTNLRGRVIPVIDLRLRIGLEETAIARATRVVAVSSRGRVLGLLVDAVLQVVHLDLDQVQPPPDDVMTVQSDYIRGVYDREDGLILLLDIDRALIIREAGAA
ncbi:MAG: chemotaxis protein CheW, partial [Acidobacteriota bacterium]